jgi:hypothetical protein
MSRLALLFSLCLLFSCEGNSSEKLESGNILENFSYTMDTVLVDAKGEVINLGFGLTSFSLSEDKKLLYYFDRNRSLLHEIDLQELELTNNFQFVREGPNSIGFNPPQFQSLPGDRILFSTSGFGVNIFSVSGEKEKSFKFNFREIEGLDYDEGGLITYNAILSEDEKLLFAMSQLDPSLSEVKLIVVNPDQKTGKTIPLPAMELVLKSIITLQMPKTISRGPANINLQFIGGKVYISCPVTSDVYQYDYERDSLRLIEFQHKLVPNKKTGEFKNQVSDEKEFFEEMGKLIYQINFEKLLWDGERKQFFRFASIPKPDQERKWYDEAEIYLFAYDLNLNLLGEIYLPELKKVPDYSFFKDGKLWSCVNVEDELGFAVMEFKF